MDNKNNRSQKKQKPFNHVLEVQNGFIPIGMIINHIDKALNKESKNGQNSTQ